MCITSEKKIALMACWCLIIAPTGIHIKGKSTLVLMQCDIVNEHQLLCNVPEHRKGTVALFLFYSLLSFSAFTFCVFVILTVPISFLGASIVFVDTKRGQ